MAAHLQSRGLPRGARIAILSKNCAHFIMAELAIWMAGYTTVAIFPTETAETIGYVLDHSEASLLFVGKLDTWEAQKPGVSAALSRIAFPLAPDSARRDYEDWDAITTRTQPLAGRPQRAEDELAMIIYTSGSTGRPKGAMVSFGAISRAATGIVDDLRKRFGEREDSRILSYLPLAHSFERSWVEASSLVDGKTHVFFAESLDTFLQDLQRARPTMFISVPRLWLKFQQGVFAKMPPEKLDRLLGIPLLGRIVAKKVLKGLGLDAVRQAGSGSAPLPPELIRWYRRLGLKLFEGYGMTEDNSYSHSSNEQFAEPGYVGVAQAGVQVRISPEGEIQIKSPGQFSGYYKQPELTAESFTEDGFFRTGDRGELRADGLLKITGRTKELFKTAKGKYVAPAPIENLLLSNPMVELAMVSGVGQPAAYALVVLAETLRPRTGDAAVRAQVEQELGTLLKQVNTRVADYERLQMIVVAREAWTIENGCLTPTMKIKRSRIEDVASSQVDAWYAGNDKVVWQ
jgi:long-chain acyl-CoA synthetase